MQESIASSGITKKPRRRRSARAIRDARFSWAVLAIPFALYLIFALFPMAEALLLSFTNWSLLTLQGQFVGLANYVHLFTSPTFWEAFKNTVWFMLVTNLGSIVLGLALALLLSRRSWVTQSARAILYIPSVMSVVVVSEMFIDLLGPSQGNLVNWVVHWFGIPPQNWLVSPTLALPALMFLALWQGMGWTMVFFLAGLQGIPRYLYEAAQLDGATGWKAFRYITWPLLRPVTTLLLILGYINGFQVFAQMQLMTNGGPDNRTLSLVLYLYQEGFQFYKMGYASAIGMVLFLVTLIVSFLQLQRSRRQWSAYY
jgi:ABC-type sugar transport system permease subunit